MANNQMRANVLFLIGCRLNNQIYYLASHSSLTNTIHLDNQLKYSKINHFLFSVEVQSSQQQSAPRRFYDPLVIKHHYSNKYLNFGHQREQFSSEGFELRLSHDKAKWAVLPCFKYQTKNTEYIEFGERVQVSQAMYLDSSAKHLFIREGESGVNMLFGYYYRSQIIFVKYHEFGLNNYHLGQYLKVYHQQSHAYLVDSQPIPSIFNLTNQQPIRYPIAFKNQQQTIGQTQLDSVWVVEEAIPLKGSTAIDGTLRTGIEVRLKNVLTGNYLHLMDNSIDDQNYKMMGEQSESIYSTFLLQAVRSSHQGPISDTQIRLKHAKIYQYMAVSKYRQSHALIEITMDKIPQDEHFYQFQRINLQRQLTISFLLTLKKELEIINRSLSLSECAHTSFEEMRKIFEFLKQDFRLMDGDESNSIFGKEQLQHFIPLVASIIQHLQDKLSQSIDKAIVEQLIRHSYLLMLHIIEGNKANKTKAFTFIHIFIRGLFQEAHAEELIIQILQNNMPLLSKLGELNPHLKCNLIEGIMRNIGGDQKEYGYWRKMEKIIRVFLTLVKVHDNFIDINQRILVLLLFGEKKLFDLLFFQMKIKKSAFVVTHPSTRAETPINNLAGDTLKLVESTLSFLSSLCEDRNIISKKLINSYLYDNLPKNEDLKIITNAFYIRQRGLKSQVLLLLTNLYVDSFPRIARYFPVAVLTIDLDSMKTTEPSNANSEINELSTLLKDSIMQKAERSYYSRPLSSIRMAYDSQHANEKAQPSFTSAQINELKKIVILLLESEEWSIEMLRITRILLELSLFTAQQKLTIYELVVEEVGQYSADTMLVKEILEVLNKLLKLLQQDTLQQVSTYLVLLNLQYREVLSAEDVGHMIESRKQIRDDARSSATIKLVTAKYNQYSKNIHHYYQQPHMLRSLINTLTKHPYDPRTTLQFIQTIIFLHTPSLQTVKFLTNCSIVSQNDLPQYHQLQNYSIQISDLTQVSQQWLCGQDKLNEDHNKFLKLMSEMTNFLYQSYEFDTQQSQNYRKNHKINKTRQVLMKNTGVHRYVLSLLDSNYYLLEGHSLRTLPSKVRQTFEKCFQFLYHFCWQCEQNKEIMISQMRVVKQFTNLVETGQTKLWILLVKNRKKLIQQMQVGDFERLIFKITKDRVSFAYSNCDYDPLYIEQLLILIDINGKPYKPNIDKIAKVLQEPILFKKMLYLSEDATVKNQFCLELYKIKFDPIQTPVIYQTKLIELMVYMIRQLGSKNSFLRRALMSIISLDYLFYILSLEDSFAFEGIPTDMNFMFKIQVLKLMQIYLSTKDISLQVYASVELTRFLQYYNDIFTNPPKKAPSMVDNEMLYYEYISPHEPYINYYLENTKEYYDKFLKKIYIRLYEILSKIAEKEKDYNYQLISVLIDESKLVLKCSSMQKIEKERDILIKWSNFIPSQGHPHHEQLAKKHLFQLLRHPSTQQHLKVEKQGFFNEIEEHEQQFLGVIKHLLLEIQSQFQDFHHQPMFKLILMLHQLVVFKVHKPEEPFSVEKPKSKLSSTFPALVIPLMKLLCINTFDYNRIFCRKIYHYSLLIITTILSFENSLKMHQSILSFLKAAPNATILLQSLSICLSQGKEEEKVESVIQQINEAQSQMKLISQQENIHPFISSLRFMIQLCRYSPFTSYFHSQSNTSKSINFVELVYTNLIIILSRGGGQLNIVAVQRIEYLCEALISLFTGCNKLNQQVVANKQFIKYAEAFLKIDRLTLNQLDETVLEAKIDLISSYYRETIPQYKGMLIKQLNYFRFTHFAVVNCIKTQLVKLFLAATITNRLVVQKLLPHISIELLKLSLIILHEEVLNNNQHLEERFFLQQFQDWKHIYQHQDQYKISMTLPPYGLALIQALEGYTQEEVSEGQEQDQPASVQKFLPPNIRLLLKELKDEPFFRDILLFYQKYFKAFNFFRKYVSQVEVDLSGKGLLINVMYPRLPLCNKIRQDFQQQLERESNRLNQHQKSKSLFNFAEKFYEEIEGEIQFDRRLTSKVQLTKYLIAIFESGNKFVSLFWGINIVICLLYLLCNFERYAWTSLRQESFVIYEPKTFLRGSLLVFEILNLMLCCTLVVFMVVKKIPFYLYLHLKSFHKLQQNQRVGLLKYQVTYGLLNLITSIGLDLFLILFSFLSIIHPMFSSFIILYIAIRFQMGRLLIKMVSSLLGELMALIGVLIVFNYVYAIVIYVSLTEGVSYGAECIDLYVCMKLFMDQIIKGGFVTLLPNNYVNNVINSHFFMEYSYNILVPGVLISIFRGVMFDRMSFLRERVEFIEKDQRTKCFVCGQSQFEIDLNLQGYQRHLKHTHNRVNYICFLFYLKRKKKQKYLFYEHLVIDSLERSNYTWVPFETSMERKKKFPNELVKQTSKLKVFHSLQQKHEQFRKTLLTTIRVKTQIQQIFDAQEQRRLALESLLKETSMMKGKSKAKISMTLANQPT